MCLSYRLETVADEAEHGSGPQQQRKLISEQFFQKLDPPAMYIAEVAKPKWEIQCRQSIEGASSQSRVNVL